MSSGRRLRLAVSVLLAVGLVIGGSVAGLAGVRPDARLVAVRGALDGLRADIDLVHVVLDGLERRVRHVDGDLGALRDLAAATDAGLAAHERALSKSHDLATELVATGRVPGRAVVPETLTDLRAPLEIVNDAIYANDQLAIALLDARGDEERRVAEARGILTDLRRTSFQLEKQERLVRAKLTEAVRSAYLLGDASADPDLRAEAGRLITRAREELHRIDIARGELRAREQEVLEETVALDARVASVRRGLREVRAVSRDLYQDMALAEVLVASRLDGWQGPGIDELSIALTGTLRVCPVDQPMSYSDNWHAPRWGGGFHLHQGIDIFAPPGTPIRAPFDGVSVVADNWLGGLAVKVYGDGGYVYNAHLSEHGVLGPVKAGDIVGYVGSTGNASGPHDHFEYHPGNGDAINPYPFLNAVC